METVLSIEKELKEAVIGQDEAIERVVRALEGAIFELNDMGKRPRASFLFMGPTGVGKTSTAKGIARHLFESENCVMLYMNEMQNPTDVPAFVEAISEAVKQYPDGGVLLFDEIEKAYKGIVDFFLSILEEGEITLKFGPRISVSNWYIVMTSNIGAERWGGMRKTKYSVMKQFAEEQAKRKLRPELFWRLNEVIVFRPLDQVTQKRILRANLDRKIDFLEKRLGRLRVDTSVEPFLLRKCFTQSGGARHLKAELDRQINAAVLPWSKARKHPIEKKFYHAPMWDRLVLR